MPALSEMPLTDNEFEVPSWAVVAIGESRLEPVCESGDMREPIDLTERVSYCLGRSPSNNIELHHRTSSRRHAIIFHHPDGSCYVLDCRSGHGTYVNGNRIPPVTPLRVRRGSLIRFGGPGAPCFILKCFSSDLDKLVRDLGGVADAFSRGTSSREFGLLQQQTQKSGVACIRGEGGMACIIDEHDAPVAALVLLNTRLNACGGISSFNQTERSLAVKAKMQLNAKMYGQTTLKRRRSVGSSDEDYTVSVSKKVKECSPKSILSACKNISEIETGLEWTMPKISEKLDAVQTSKDTLKTRVSFSDEPPKNIYPAAVTPDELSSESEGEDDEIISIMKPFEVPCSSSAFL